GAAGVPDDRADAVHLLDHQRYRRRLRLVRGAAGRPRPGPDDPPAAVGGGRAVRGLLRAGADRGPARHHLTRSPAGSSPQGGTRGAKPPKGSFDMLTMW